MTEESNNLPGLSSASLVDAADALETALRRFEELTSSACRVGLNSEKNLARAARAINEAAASQERISQALSALVKHINVAQTRQQTTSERVYERAKQIQERTREFESLMKELIAVGQEAGAITSELQTITGEQSAAGVENGKSELKARLALLAERMSEAVTRAANVEKLAQKGELTDVVRHADSLRQQIEAARVKLASWTDA